MLLMWFGCFVVEEQGVAGLGGCWGWGFDGEKDGIRVGGR